MRFRVILAVALFGIGLVAVVLAVLVTRETGPLATATPPPVPVAGTLERVERDLKTLGGVVRGPDGRPLGGALACDYPTFDAPVSCAATAADGRFSLLAPAGFHKLHVVAPPGASLLPQWYDGGERSRDATILDLRRLDRSDVVATLDTARRISGRITGARDGRIVVDAIVCAAPSDDAGEWVCGRTDGTGRYALAVRAARYQIFFVPPDDTRLIPQWWDGADEPLGSSFLDVRARDATGIDAGLVEGHLITGTIRAAGSGEPVERALVCADTPFPTGRICRPTDQQGRYSVAVRSGTFVLQFKPRASSRLVSEWYGGAPDWRTARRVAVEGDVRVDAALRVGRVLSGEIRAGEDGAPLEGASVNVYDASRPCCAAAATAIAGIGGDYVTVVPPGRYWVEFFPPTGTPYVSAYYGGADLAHARVVQVKASEDAGFLDARLEEVKLDF